MSEHKGEPWLDRQLRRAVGGDTPSFDAESWKRRHRDEYEALLARAGQSGRGRVRWVWGRRGAGLAVAAAVILAVGMFLTNEPRRTIPPEDLVAASPAEMMNMMSLRLAYEQGGFDGLDRQLLSTLDEFGPRSLGVPSWRLF